MKQEKTIYHNAEKLYKLIKKNLSLLIIFPPLIGGLWQVIELSSLSISFLRFFSVSQLVADGILILIVFLFFIVSLLIFPIAAYWLFPPSLSLKEAVENSDQNPIKKEEEKSFVDKNPFISFIGFYGFIYVLFWGMEKYPVTSIKELLLYTTVGSLAIYYLRIIYLRERRKTLKYKKIVYLCSIFVFITMFLYVALFCRHMHNLFLLPKDVINVERLKNNISYQHPKDTVEILYSNDKYIFLEIRNKKSKILITPFEDLVKNKE